MEANYIIILSCRGDKGGERMKTTQQDKKHYKRTDRYTDGIILFEQFN